MVDGSVECILVLEKNTIYYALCETKFHIDMVTGKGEPDERTRGFVCLLDEKVDLPIYGITDPDPYGIRIMKCYAKGYINLAMCNVHYATISIHWLGITTLCHYLAVCPLRSNCIAK